MKDIADQGTPTRRLKGFPQIRRIHSESRTARSPLLNSVILIAISAIAVLLAYKLIFNPGSWVKSEVIDLSQSVEQIQELSTVKSHLRFTVVVREEGGNVIVRSLADQPEAIGMENLSAALFQDPTMIVALHGVATYGVRLDNLASNIQQDDSSLTITLPPADVLDVKLVTADTKIVAQMKGLFRSSNQSLLHEANMRGEDFARDFARQDTTLLNVAEERARGVLGLIVSRGGKRAEFVER